MLERLHLVNVGPAPEMTIELGSRLNLITGDNGLGKSFLLDTIWWALARTWPSLPARPIPGSNGATIRFKFEDQRDIGEAWFDRARQSWHFKQAVPRLGLVLYARVDGGFNVWDPARNPTESAPDSYAFQPAHVWDGLEWDGRVSCNGLIRDWVSWQRESAPTFRQLESALAKLSPSPDEELQAGEPTRISLDDVRDIPTLRMPYGQDVPVLHASAGMKRILQLAYLMVWAWHEHELASKLLGQPIAGQVVVLIDEVESHLHPKWQRLILPSLLAAAQALTRTEQTSIQVIASTHSPLVLASLEPHFDPSKDAWFDLDLEQGKPDAKVQLRKREFVRHGDVSNWLTSEAFDLKSARSKDAEDAIVDAHALLRSRDPAPLSAVEAIDQKLRGVLGDVDPFWVRWSAFVEQRRAKE